MAVAMAMPQQHRPFGGFGQGGFGQLGGGFGQPGFYQGGFGQPGFQQTGLFGPNALSKQPNHLFSKFQ